MDNYSMRMAAEKVEKQMAARDHAKDQKILAPLLGMADGSKDRIALKDFRRPRSVFSPGHRIRMNIIPLFLNIFVPWGIFCFVLAINSFWMVYSRPALVIFLTGIFVVIWLISVAVAWERRKNDPEPTWYIYFSIILGLALLGAIIMGRNIYNDNSLPYYMVNDLKVLGNLDAGKERGQNVMDAGIFYFAEGNQLDQRRSWHFKQGTTYCVSPVIKGNYPSVPESQSFDFWAVGKDCCSETASDFRCGAFNNPLARAGIRILDDKDRPFYRLAVEQAESLNQIVSEHPVFFQWEQDPLKTVNGWSTRGFTKFLMCAVFGMIFVVFGVACATCSFAWMGRSESPYGQDIVGDPEYRAGGPKQGPKDFHTHMRHV